MQNEINMSGLKQYILMKYSFLRLQVNTNSNCMARLHQFYIYQSTA